MSVVTYINKIPLFSTIQEALQWGTNRNLTGYHTHTFNGQVGYMGGATHSNATTQSTSSTTISSSGSSSSSSSGGGGGGGY